MNETLQRLNPEFWLSMAFLAVYIIALIFLLFRTKRKSNSKGVKFLPLFLIGLSVFCLRFGLSDELMIVDETKMPGESKVFFALIETLRTFMLDGSFGTVIVAATNVYNSFAVNIYASILFVLAPITGGALIIEVISSIYPRLRLVLCNRCFFWKEMHYFSELNEKSLALAKSIRVSKNILTRRSIVFTDVYTDSEERITELYLGAKNIGAICISDDLLHTHIRCVGKKKIYLMDENEINNLQALSALTETGSVKKLRNTEIYLFNSDDTFAVAGCDIEKHIKELWTEKAKDKLKKKEIARTGKFDKKTVEKDAAKAVKSENFKIIPVNGKRNLVRNLFYSLPLYEPLVGNKGKKTLNVTILGVGEIGTEAFLSAYWYGQLLGYDLSINVVSLESEEEFRKKIDYINPDILMTASSCDLLRIYPDKEKLAKPYFKFRYYSANLKSVNIRTLLTTKAEDDGFILASTDYFVVALGADEDNLAVADKIKKSVTEYKLKNKISEKCIISYVIYNSELSGALNRNNTDTRKIYDGIYMHAFGALEEVYHKKNVFMEAAAISAENVGNSYQSIKDKVGAASVDKDFYSYWSDIARAVHIKYKVFSAGEVTASVFSQDYDKFQEQNLKTYKSRIIKDEQLRLKLAWLEHRRWNAYMRASGMRCPDDFTVYSEKTKDYKNIDLKLHPCIAECDGNKMKPYLFSEEVSDDLDMLDIASRDIYYKVNIHKKDGKPEDYKTYDYPEYDF